MFVLNLHCGFLKNLFWGWRGRGEVGSKCRFGNLTTSQKKTSNHACYKQPACYHSDPRNMKHETNLCLSDIKDESDKVMINNERKKENGCIKLSREQRRKKCF